MAAKAVHAVDSDAQSPYNAVFKDLKASRATSLKMDEDLVSSQGLRVIYESEYDPIDRAHHNRLSRGCAREVEMSELSNVSGGTAI